MGYARAKGTTRICVNAGTEIRQTHRGVERGRDSEADEEAGGYSGRKNDGTSAEGGNPVRSNEAA